MTVGDPLAWLVTQAQDWIRAQRIAHRPDAITLSDPMKTLLHSFFDSTVLDQARYRTVPTIQNPPFMEQAVAMWIPRAIDFSQMAGITFQDVFLVSQSVPVLNPLALIFHELVHVVQYAILGVEEFARQYVHGLATGGFSYAAIPLEAMAYRLQARFEQDPRTPFSVRDEVRPQLEGLAGGRA